MTKPGKQDTIAAIATPPGEGGIAIVRVSGPDSLRVADAVFAARPPPPSQRAAGTFVHGRVLDAGKLVDDVLLLIMRAPHSYTGEDTVEFQGHGGSLPARGVLRAVLQAGARLAEPGEFTQRAFLNGRMDLMQAEAVLDLIRARSDRAARAALGQLEGGLSRRIHEAYDEILRLAADAEASLDFPEDELPATVLADLRDRLVRARADLDALQATGNEGRILREGARVAIAGRPNAGKSTLLNALLGTDRAIVSHHPGTTRDTIEEQLVVGGLPVCLVDTAGLREAVCEIEQEGIRRAINVLQQADAYLFVVDGSLPCHVDDVLHLAGLPVDRCLVIRNKADLGDRWQSPDPRLRTVLASLIKGDGVETIRSELLSVLGRGQDEMESSYIVVSERHANLIRLAIQHLDETNGRLDDRMLDLAASCLRESLEALGRITGRTYEKELLDNIFSRFCIGK